MRTRSDVNYYAGTLLRHDVSDPRFSDRLYTFQEMYLYEYEPGGYRCPPAPLGHDRVKSNGINIANLDESETL